MATGKKALDIFTPTTGKKADIGIEVPERIEGRPRAAEPYRKVTVTLYDRQIIALDKVALAIRERYGQAVSRAEVIRAILDGAPILAPVAGDDPKAPGYDKAILDLFPILKG